MLIVLNDDIVVCEDCYEPPELEVDPGLVPFTRVAVGACYFCGATYDDADAVVRDECKP